MSYQRWEIEATYCYSDLSGRFLKLVNKYRKPDGGKVPIPFMLHCNNLVYGEGSVWCVPGKKMGLKCLIPIEGLTDPNKPPDNEVAIWVPKCKRSLYRQKELYEALFEEPDTYVFFCEGEKDVDTLTGLGLVATTNPGGALGFKEEDVEHFKNVHVILVEDNDETGRQRVQRIAQLLYGKAASIRILTFRDMPEKSDITDWVEAQQNRD